MKGIKTSFSLCAMTACLMLMIAAGCSNETESLEGEGSSNINSVYEEPSADGEEEIPAGWSKGDDNIYSGFIIGFDKNEVIIYINEMTSSSSVIEHLAPGTAVSVKTEELGVADMAIKDSVKFKIRAYSSYPQSNPCNALVPYVVCYSKILIIEYTPMR